MQMLIPHTLSRVSWSGTSLSMSWHQQGCACLDSCTDHFRAHVSVIANNGWADGRSERQTGLFSHWRIYQWLFQPGGRHMGPGLGLSEIYVVCFGPWAMCDGSLVASCGHITLRWLSPQPADWLEVVWDLWYQRWKHSESHIPGGAPHWKWGGGD